MCPVADRTKEHLGVSATSIIRIRRPILKMVKDQIGAVPVASPPAVSYRLRPTPFKAKPDEAFENFS